MNCAFSKLVNYPWYLRSGDTMKIECRLNPPNAVNERGERVFPIVQDGDWCGKFKALSPLPPPPLPAPTPEEPVA